MFHARNYETDTLETRLIEGRSRCNVKPAIRQRFGFVVTGLMLAILIFGVAWPNWYFWQEIKASRAERVEMKETLDSANEIMLNVLRHMKEDHNAVGRRRETPTTSGHEPADGAN